MPGGTGTSAARPRRAGGAGGHAGGPFPLTHPGPVRPLPARGRTVLALRPEPPRYRLVAAVGTLARLLSRLLRPGGRLMAPGTVELDVPPRLHQHRRRAAELEVS